MIASLSQAVEAIEARLSADPSLPVDLAALGVGCHGDSRQRRRVVARCSHES